MRNLQNETFSYLRFPLILGVVFIHSYNADPTIHSNYPIFGMIQTLISQVIGRLSVPSFFFISGYLFFYNVKSWSFDLYRYKINRRVKSLLIPYLFWISLMILVYYIAQKFTILAPFFSGNHTRIEDFTMRNFLEAYWSIPITTDPFVYQFWFIRDLIVIVALSPIVYYFSKYLKWFGVLLLCILWFIGAFHFPGFSLLCIFFFTTGAYFSIHGKDTLVFFNKIKILGYFYPAFAIIDACTKSDPINSYMHNLGILSGLVMIFNLSSYLLNTKKITTNTFLSAASFFVFAFHEPLLTLLRRLTLLILKPSSDSAHLMSYFLPALITVAISLIVYRALEKTLPALLKYISGGR